MSGNEGAGAGGISAARWVSAVTTPYITTPLFILLAGLHFVRDLGLIVLYGAVAVGFTVLIPLGYAEHLRRSGRVDSVHIFDQRARLGPLALTGASSMAGLAVLWVIDAPEGVLRLGALLFLMAGAILGATMVLKISGHVSAWAAGCTVAIVLWGPLLAPLLLGAVPVAWSRRALDRHTDQELVGGFAFGISVMLALTWGVGLLQI